MHFHEQFPPSSKTPKQGPQTPEGMLELAEALAGWIVFPKAGTAKLRESWGGSQGWQGLCWAPCEPGTPLRSKVPARTQDLESRRPGMNNSRVWHFLNHSGKRRFLQHPPGAFPAASSGRAGSPPRPMAWGKRTSPVPPNWSWGTSRVSSSRQAAARASSNRQGDARCPRLLRGTPCASSQSSGWEQAQGICSPC